MLQRLTIAVLAAVFCAAPVLAQCKKTCDKAKTCQMKDQGKASCQDKAKDAHQHAAGDKAKAAMCDSDVTCDGDRVRFKDVNIPRIGFKVGDKVTCCMKSVKEMVAGDMSNVKFVVADKTYDNLGEAKAARVKVLEQFYKDMFAVKFAVGDECVACPMTAQDMAKSSGKPMKYRLVSFDFEKKAQAEKAAEAARGAGEKVSMSWAVGEKKFNCPKEAGAAAKATEGQVEYCVGDQKTVCETTAKTRLLEARITAALETLAKAAQG